MLCAMEGDMLGLASDGKCECVLLGDDVPGKVGLLDGT